MSIWKKKIEITRLFMQISMPSDQLGVMQWSCVISIKEDFNTLDFIIIIFVSIVHFNSVDKTTPA